MEVQENRLAVQPPSPPPAAVEPLPADPLAKLRDPALSVLTNLNLADDRAHAIISRAMAKADFELAESANAVLEVTGYFAHVVPITIEETGEIQPRARVVLITREGKTLAWTSANTTKYWVMIMGLKGQGPWNPPIRVKVVAYKGKKAGHWYSLELIDTPKEIKGR